MRDALGGIQVCLVNSLGTIKSMAIELAAAVGTVRALANVVKEAGKIELYQKVLDLQQILLEAITDNTRLAAENHALSERVRALEAELASQRAGAALRFDGQVYWSGKPGDEGAGPFCPRCKDKDDKHVRMADRGNGFTCCVGCDHCVENKFIRYPGLRLSAPYEPPDEPFNAYAY
jgi:hypothetical protein